MFHARFERFKNHDGNWQWKCTKVWEALFGIAYGSNWLYVNVNRKPPVGFCRRPDYYI